MLAIFILRGAVLLVSVVSVFIFAGFTAVDNKYRASFLITMSPKALERADIDPSQFKHAGLMQPA